MKEALVFRGRIDRAVVHPPLQPVSEAERRQIWTALGKAGLFAPGPGLGDSGAVDNQVNGAQGNSRGSKSRGTSMEVSWRVELLFVLAMRTLFLAQKAPSPQEIPHILFVSAKWA